MKNKVLAEKILSKVGGEENITHLTHCATRIRVNLKDDSKAELDSISDLEGVLKAQNQNGQTQIIIGAKVNSIYSEMEQMISTTPSNEPPQDGGKPKNKVSTVIETIAGIFSPAIPIIIAGGMVKALNAVLINMNVANPDASYMQMMNIIGDFVFYFLPFFLALGAARKFNANEYVALGLAAVYMYPTIIDGANAAAETGADSIDLFGLPVLLVDYSSTVIPIILSVWIMSFVYKRVDKLIPDFLKIILTGMIVMLIMAPVQLIAIGPLGSYIGEWLADFIIWFYSVGGVFAAFLLGATRSALTMLGMHYALAPIQIQEIAATGSSVILVSALTANMSQAGAALGVFFAVKEKSMKTLAASSSLSAFFGITEPAMFGVNLKYRRPFFIALGSSGIAAIFLEIFNTSSTAYVPPSILTLPIFQADSFIYVMTGALLSAGMACIITYMYGIPKDKQNKAEDNEMLEEAKAGAVEENKDILSPIKGRTIALTEVNDQVFSQGLIGDGIAVEPVEGKVFAPFDGRIEVLYNSKHAIGLKSESGTEVLIHVGLDTVNLDGEHFTSKIEQGQEVKVGDLLLEFDIESIEKEGYETITPVIITNSPDFFSIEYETGTEVSNDSVLISLEQEQYK